MDVLQVGGSEGIGPRLPEYIPGAELFAPGTGTFMVTSACGHSTTVTGQMIASSGPARGCSRGTHVQVAPVGRIRLVGHVEAVVLTGAADKGPKLALLRQWNKCSTASHPSATIRIRAVKETSAVERLFTHLAGRIRKVAAELAARRRTRGVHSRRHRVFSVPRRQAVVVHGGPTLQLRSLSSGPEGEQQHGGQGQRATLHLSLSL